MHKLFYSRNGQDLWQEFHTGPEIWMTQEGRTLRDSFETAQEAENVVSQWFGNGHNHWPVCIWDTKRRSPLLIYQMDAWPYEGENKAGVQVIRWPWTNVFTPQDSLVVVV